MQNNLCRLILSRAGMGMASAMVLTGVVVAGSFAVYNISLNLSGKSADNLNKRRTSSNNDLVVNRAVHALAMGAVLCKAPKRDDGKGKCKWTDEVEKKEGTFGFENGASRAFADKLSIFTNACIPAPGESITSENCRPVRAKVNFELVNATNFFEEILVGEERADGDNDKWAVRVSAEGTYKDSNGQDRTYESSALLRRPRMFLRVETSSGVCDRGCVLSEGVGPLRSCITRPGHVGDSSSSTRGTKMTVRVYNEGPGHVYRFKVKRRFVPNPDLSNDRPFSDVVYDSVSAGLEAGLAPGGYVEFEDTGTPCYESRVNHAETSRELAGTISVESRFDRVHSGNVYYSFLEDGVNLDPPNALQLASDSTTVQARSVEVTAYRAPTNPGCVGPGCTICFDCGPGPGGPTIISDQDSRDGGPDGPDGCGI